MRGFPNAKADHHAFLEAVSLSVIKRNYGAKVTEFNGFQFRPSNIPYIRLTMQLDPEESRFGYGRNRRKGQGNYSGFIRTGLRRLTGKQD
jgi:hypothetical protein